MFIVIFLFLPGVVLVQIPGSPDSRLSAGLSAQAVDANCKSHINEIEAECVLHTNAARRIKASACNHHISSTWIVSTSCVLAFVFYAVFCLGCLSNIAELYQTSRRVVLEESDSPGRNNWLQP